MNLAEFLLERIAEDEAAAARLKGGAYFRWPFTPDNYGRLGGSTPVTNDWSSPPPIAAYVPVSEHASRHDPARVLAECEAKRWLIALHSDRMTIYGSDDEFCEQCSHWSREGLDDYYEPWPCEHLRILASVYRDHPDFDPAWSVT